MADVAVVAHAGKSLGGGLSFFTGKVSCVLAANVGRILGGVEEFPQAEPDDGPASVTICVPPT